MKRLSMIIVAAALASAAVLSLNALAADDTLQPNGATLPTGAHASHMLVSESMADGKMPTMKEHAAADAPKDSPRKKSEPDRSRHFHPRDGK